MDTGNDVLTTREPVAKQDKFGFDLEERWIVQYCQPIDFKYVGVWDTVAALGLRGLRGHDTQFTISSLPPSPVQVFGITELRGHDTQFAISIAHSYLPLAPSRRGSTQADSHSMRRRVMRTTLKIDAAVLAAAKAIAKAQSRTDGAVVSELARNGLRAPRQLSARNGAPLVTINNPAALVSLDAINALRDAAR
jgi:hypothetical protein